jgi:micrococcal nuclease
MKIKRNIVSNRFIFSFSFISHKLTRMAFLYSLIILFSFGCNNINEVPKYPKSGKVISIIDGDTYDLLTKDKETIRIRMEGIDAPEKGMPFYQVSKNYLGKLCFQKNVKIEVTSKDANGRYLAFTYLYDGTELSHEMIKSGLAWHFKKYNSDSILSNLEVEARNLKIGLWIDKDPMPPWENRSLHYKGISTKDSFNIKVGQE